MQKQESVNEFQGLFLDILEISFGGNFTSHDVAVRFAIPNPDGGYKHGIDLDANAVRFTGILARPMQYSEAWESWLPMGDWQDITPLVYALKDAALINPFERWRDCIADHERDFSVKLESL